MKLINLNNYIPNKINVFIFLKFGQYINLTTHEIDGHNIHLIVGYFEKSLVLQQFFFIFDFIKLFSKNSLPYRKIYQQKIYYSRLRIQNPSYIHYAPDRQRRKNRFHKKINNTNITPFLDPTLTLSIDALVRECALKICALLGKGPMKKFATIRIFMRPASDRFPRNYINT